MDIKKITIASSLVVSMGLASMSVSAADITTDSTVKFIENNEKETPKNPINPEEEMDLEPIPNPGTDGPLSIDFAPDFDFSEQKISGDDEIYYSNLLKTAGAEEADVPLFVQVTDKRGTNGGWKLSVKQNEEFKDSNDQVLAGAELGIHYVNANSVLEQNENTKGQFTPNTSVAEPISINGSKVVMEAVKGKGMGTWTAVFADENFDDKKAKAVSLKVPGTSQKNADETYNTTIEWTLTDAE
ncbi:MAG: WxL domain-containing protein [Bacillota bacterium]